MPASSFRLIPGEWLFLLPRQEQAQVVHSPAPSWPHLTACTLAAPVEKVHGSEITYHQHGYGDGDLPRWWGITYCLQTREMSDGPQQPLLLLSYGKTALNCSLMMAAAVRGQNWPHWVELQTACRASCLAQWLWALSRQSCRNVHICHAERRLESLQCGGGLPGNPELPSSGNRRGFGSRKVRPAAFTSSERTQKGIKIFSPTSVT